MENFHKAEKKHYEEWLDKDESNLVDTLLILNETSFNESRFPSIVLLNDLVSKAIPREVPRIDLVFPYQSAFLLKIKDILSLIFSEKVKVLKKPDSLMRFGGKYYFNETFQNRFFEDSKLLLETTVKPIDFVTQLLEYKNMLPETLQVLINPDKQIPTPILSSKPVTQGLDKPTHHPSKPLDPRRENTYQTIIGAFMEQHYKNYDPDAPKNMDTSKVLDLLDNVGSDLSRATLKKVLDESIRFVRAIRKRK